RVPAPAPSHRLPPWRRGRWVRGRGSAAPKAMGRESVMTGTTRWRFGSTARTRRLVLLALGVVKVATAAQLRQLVVPGTADVQTVRNACKDLRDAGLLESVGKVTGTNLSGRSVSEQLWNLTTAGLAVAATELDRPLGEMGGTAREAARAGATHAVK